MRRMTKLSAYEKETIIIYNGADETASVFTYHTTLQNKLNELVGKNPDIKVTGQGEEWVRYEVPKSWIKVNPPRKRDMTEEQRAAAAERLANARKKKGE